MLAYRARVPLEMTTGTLPAGKILNKAEEDELRSNLRLMVRGYKLDIVDVEPSPAVAPAPAPTPVQQPKKGGRR